MTEETTGRTSGRAGMIVMIVIAVLVVYLLAPGPLIYFMEYTPHEATLYRIFQVVYFPVDFLARHVGFVGAFYDWYLKFFR